MVRLAHPSVELDLLAIKMVDLARVRNSSLQCHIRRQFQQEFKIWLEPVRCQFLDLVDSLFVESSRTPLICERGITESVSHDNQPLFQGGPDDFADVLSTRGCKEQHLCCGEHR